MVHIPPKYHKANVMLLFDDFQQAKEIFQNIFSSFKSKLHELKWFNQSKDTAVMKRVKFESAGIIGSFTLALYKDFSMIRFSP